MKCFNARKHSNEHICDPVDYLENVILQNKKVIFRHFDLNENGAQVYRRDGHPYVLEPVALVFNEDNYSTVVYSSCHEGTENYRVDRMDSVEVLDESLSERALPLRYSIERSTEQAVKMYGGLSETITIQFDKQIIGAVYDKFGEDSKMIRLNADDCVATVNVQVSPAFWGWIFQFWDKMRITSPDSMIEAYKTKAEKLIR